MAVRHVTIISHKTKSGENCSTRQQIDRHWRLRDDFIANLRNGGSVATQSMCMEFMHVNQNCFQIISALFHAQMYANISIYIDLQTSENMHISFMKAICISIQKAFV